MVDAILKKASYPFFGLPRMDDELNEFLYRNGLAARGEPIAWTPLTGGVASDIWRVDVARRSMCVKRALGKLRVAANWEAPTARNAYEWAWMRYASRLVPGAVPAPLAHDAALGMFAMEFLDPAAYPNWKQLLLQGAADPGTAVAVAKLLATLHGASAGDAAVAAAFETGAIFFAIRLEPYLLATARRHPDIAARLQTLADRTAAARIALVHGDVSPKNILIGPDGPVFLDAECAWFGDPAFDAAFCLNQLLLKCLARPRSMNAYLDCFAAFSGAYLSEVRWEPHEDIEGRTASLLPALLLARVDGKSPVEYVTNETAKALVRATARPLIADAPTRLMAIADAWHTALKRNPGIAGGDQVSGVDGENG